VRLLAALPPRPFLYAIVDTSLLGARSVGTAISELARGGAGLVQLRAKGASDAEFLAWAREAVAAARGAGVPLLVNDRADIAVLAGADGVHVGQEDLRPTDVRRMLPAPAIVGLSTHNRAQLEAAANEPIDYVAIGPIFETRTKRDPDPVVGLEFVREARRRTSRPLVAIGGIAGGNVSRVVEAGADGVAVISALLSADSLLRAAEELVGQLRSSRGAS
jgi:thiamine-phosphate pyrophosphorylase